MGYILAGLGNPGDEYAHTRHNTGKIVLATILSKLPKQAKVIEVNSFVNRSGAELARVLKGKAQIAKLIVIHDDLDLPLGSFKISFGRGSGGHRGVESIIRALKTPEFIRIRIGIAGRNKPKGDKKVIAHILGKFKTAELTVLKKNLKKISEAIETIVRDGLPKAMSLYN